MECKDRFKLWCMLVVLLIIFIVLNVDVQTESMRIKSRNSNNEFDYSLTSHSLTSTNWDFFNMTYSPKEKVARYIEEI